ncbi:cytochrome-c peroxidase [Shewanella gaetbuli]|uniref:Cytochrome-c peroxidase n=1 Tax=Shewanella gaetbuli TaxID=220752 RepID=A0A9X2CLT3_9GAMM|nr:cytochrome c peroxidase [Shewanella gaetbuli]MCL1143029.1 cytochrome-c peroxidase [Shewanella gaetbuli]
MKIHYIIGHILTLALIVCASISELSAQKLDNKQITSTIKLTKEQIKSIQKIALEYFQPLPNNMPGSQNDTDNKITLGKKLYFETALSLNNSQSCNSCHNILNNGSGADGLVVSVGALGHKGTRNSPTTWNAGFQFTQFWDGKVNTLAEQAKFPILNQIEMAMPSTEEVISRLKEKGYPALFQQAYPDVANPLSLGNVTDSLAAFQRTLITEDRLDRFLNGNLLALTDQEIKGLESFIIVGCAGCHNGPLLGGHMYSRMGVVNPYPNKNDKGRANISKNPADNFVFKVPTLRNVSKTAPYFHDGAVDNLTQAVKDTAFHQLGKSLSEEETNSITQFLTSMENTKTSIKQ